MQNAKDTFYELLKARLVAVNPERTIVLRGVTRPGVLVVENELLSDIAIPDCFRLSWSDVAVDANGALPMLTAQCSVEYETAGTVVNSGMDRGRALAAMDAELQQMVDAMPKTTVKMNYAALANGGTATAMQTNVWWGSVAFGKTVVKDDRISRTATIAVMSYQEAGEL
jgi:hypothetical protein